jgi:hypothetical protein
MSRPGKLGSRWRLVHRHAAPHADADADTHSDAYTDAHTLADAHSDARTDTNANGGADTHPDNHAIPNADPHRDHHPISDTDRHGRPEPHRHFGPNCDRDVVLIPICILVDRIDPHASSATPSNPTSVHRWAGTE